MPIKIKTDLEWGSVWYVKNDPYQLPHLLVGLYILPSNQFKFQLSYMGEIVELYDFEVTDLRDEELVKKTKEEDGD